MNYLLLASPVLAVLCTQLYYYFALKKFEKRVDDALKEKVDGVFETLKRDVPMGGTFLKGALETRLKEKAYKEVGKLLPDLKSGGVPLGVILYPILISLLISLVLLLIVKQ